MITKYFRLFLFFFLIGNLLISCKNKSISTRLVSVSILPQKYLTEQIAGDYLTVNVMIPPGMNPATCDLSTEQLKKLYDSDLCFTIGYLPFEQIHLFPVLENRPDIQIVNHSANLQLIHGSCGHTHAAGDEHDGVDPHIWLSPAHARTMATTVYEVHRKNIRNKNYSSNKITRPFSRRSTALPIVPNKYWIIKKTKYF